MNYQSAQSAAARLVSLFSLDAPPVALSFVDQAPEGVPAASREVPSSCAFWREGERGVFYATAEQHFNCAVGAMVMGLALPERVSQELGNLVESMCGHGYITVDEAAKIPSVQRQSAGIVYGPLSEFPIEPDAVLLWLTPAQAMLYNEAAGTARWTEPLADLSGRPGCASIPLALDRQQPRLTLGCIGMRTFTGISDDRMLAVLPASRVEEFVEALERITDANEKMESFYQGRKATFA